MGFGHITVLISCEEMQKMPKRRQIARKSEAIVAKRRRRVEYGPCGGEMSDELGVGILITPEQTTELKDQIQQQTAKNSKIEYQKDLPGKPASTMSK